MRFDMNNIHTIFESAKSKNCVPSEHADKSGSKIDATLGDSDLIGLFDNICPICGDVFASMKDAAADPKNLKLTMVKTEDLGEATKIYIEAVEFATFCEAADLNIGEAAEEILDTCKGMVPGSNDSELHVVFPSEALNKGELGSTRFGRDVRNDWAMQLLTGCRRYGIHVNSGVEDGEPVTESAYKKTEDVPDLLKKAFEYHIKNHNIPTMSLKDLDSWDDPTNGSDKTVDQMSDDELKKRNKDAYYIKKGLPFHESATESKTLKGVKIWIDGPSKKIDIAIKLCNKNWSRIVNEAAEDWFRRIDKCDDDGSLKKTYPTVSAVKSHMTLDTVRYSGEEKRNNPICGSMDLSFDVDPEIDPNHFYTLYVGFDKDSNIKFDSIFEG